MKLLNICIVTTDFSPTRGGIATLTQSLGLHLSKSSEVASVKMFALKNKYNDTQDINEKYSVSRSTESSLFGLSLKIFKLMLQNRKCDVFHATNVFPVGFFLVLFGILFNKPVFISYYGTDVLTNRGSIFTKIAKRFTLLNSKKNIALGENIKKTVLEKLKLPADGSVVISYGLSDEVKNSSEEERQKVREEFGIQKDDFIVLYVGNLIKRKGCHDLFDAVSSITDSQIKLIFVGKGEEENSLKQKQKSLGLERKIFFAGRREDLVPFYEIASVFSMPSYYDLESGDIEGLGIVFLEAAIYNIPSVSTRSGGISDAIEDGKTGFLVRERDIKALREKIVFLKENEDVRKDLGLQAKVFVTEKFNWRKSVTKHISLYQEFS